MCPLGKWLYGEGSEYHQMLEMQQLIQIHAEMHATVGKVIDAKEAGDMEMAHQFKEKVAQLSEKIIQLIDQVETQVSSKTSTTSEKPLAIENHTTTTSSDVLANMQWDEF